MTLAVPFDGSALSQAALIRAVQFDSVLHEGIVVISVIPKGNDRYARERGWIDETEAFDADAIVDYLRGMVTEIAPDAEFEHSFVDRYAPVGTIANRVRQIIRDSDPTIVFVGSENGGSVVQRLSVGQSVSGDRAYDTMIVSHTEPTRIETLEDELQTDEILS